MQNKRQWFDFKLVAGIIWVFMGLWLMVGVFAFDRAPVWYIAAHIVVGLAYIATAQAICDWLDGK